MSVDLDHGHLEETIDFYPDEDRIDRLGSLLYSDAQGQQQTIVWSEDLLYIANSDEEDEIELDAITKS